MAGTCSTASLRPRMIGFPPTHFEKSFVDLSAVSDAGYVHQLRGVVDDVDDAPIADSNAPLVFVPLELPAACGPRIFGESHNLPVDSAKHSVIEGIQFFLGGVLDLKRILSHALDCV